MRPRLAFVTTFCPHYRVKTFETLAARYDTRFIFFSSGGDWFWQRQHGVAAGSFQSDYLPGFRLFGTRVNPVLPWALARLDYDVVVKCINGRFALPVTFCVARLRHKPFILWTGVWMRLQRPVHRLFFPMTRYIYRHADAIVVYGAHVKRYLVSEGVPPERIFVAPHAVDNAVHERVVPAEEIAALRQELRIAPEQKVVLYLGRLEPEKGLNYLVEAFASLPRNDDVLVLAGTGSERTFLESLVQEKGLADRVRFPGYVPQPMTTPYYATAWVMVLPSITTPQFKEPWGLVVNEAFNQGLPVIASDSVGAAAGGLLCDGVNGLVVPERNAEALSRSLESILTQPDLRASLSANARTAIASWTNERMVLSFQQAIEFAVTGGKGEAIGV